jgi:hypothetical protein
MYMAAANCELANFVFETDLRTPKVLNLKSIGEPASELFSWMYAMGKSVWKKWKKRYFVLVQVNNER